MLLSWVLLLSAAGVSQPDRSDAVVRQLYGHIIARRPIGIPSGADKEAIWPLLSRKLVGQLDAAQACEADYRRLHAADDGKPEFGWLESGLFSGEHEMALPAEVTVERTERFAAGSFRVLVQFTYRESFDTSSRTPHRTSALRWRGAALVVSENGRFVVDDVEVFEKGSATAHSRLSRAFVGCDGPRWVGHRQER